MLRSPPPPRRGKSRLGPAPHLPDRARSYCCDRPTVAPPGRRRRKALTRSTTRGAFACGRARPTRPGSPPARAKRSSASLPATTRDLRGAKRGATRSSVSQAAPPPTWSDTEEQRERNQPLVLFHRVEGRKSKEDEMNRLINLALVIGALAIVAGSFAFAGTDPRSPPNRMSARIAKALDAIDATLEQRAADQIDPDALRQVMDSRADQMKLLAAAIIPDLVKMHDALTPAQRQALYEEWAARQEVREQRQQQ